MQNIAVADQCLASVESGDRKIAIRVGMTQITPGPLEVKSASGVWETVRVDVETVVLMPLSQLTAEQFRECGYTDIENFIAVQQSCYPCINPETDISLIIWR